MFAQLTHYKQRWNLKDDGEPFSTYSGILQPVSYDGKDCMLKITSRKKDKRSNNLMVWWNGKGAARVLRHDDTVILMERATEAGSLSKMAKNGRDGEASDILCNVVAQLHNHPAPYPTDLVPLKLWFKELEPAAAKYGGVFVNCSFIANQLLDSQENIVALHGDIHHGNVLDFGERGWLAIDPKGLIGERGFDYANIFCNPDAAVATEPGRLMKQVKVVSDVAKLEPNRLLQWIAAWAGLSAIWSISDETDHQTAAAVAEIAIGCL
jgi:streptomycin 6-kinase